MRVRKIVPLLCLLGLLVADRTLTATGKAASHLSDVHVLPATFLPSLGQQVHLTAMLAAAGTLRVDVLDRDGFVVRTLAAGKPVKAGPLTLAWDGKDGQGTVVPDDAYSFRIELKTATGRSVYFPARQAAEMYEVRPSYYSRADATLVYELPKPSRVHLQAGEATLDPATKKMQGPVLKTIVNREPRAGGRVVETWDGYDESGLVYVPDLPNFVASVMATSLPENAVITRGNRKESFLAWAVRRTGKSLLPPSKPPHFHHEGLTVLEDVSPQLVLRPEESVWSDAEKGWQLPGSAVSLAIDLAGLSAPGFSRNPAKIYVFVDGKQLTIRPATAPPVALPIDLSSVAPGPHFVSVCWTSEYGPVAANTTRVLVRGPSVAGGGL